VAFIIEKLKFKIFGQKSKIGHTIEEVYSLRTSNFEVRKIVVEEILQGRNKGNADSGLRDDFGQKNMIQLLNFSTKILIF